jgi:CubicO group peptidase (beta-lactamase class C family)
MIRKDVKQFLDSLLNKAYPGYVCAICNLDGTVEKFKGGISEYSSDKENINFNTFFDLASLSKVVGTTMLALKYTDEGIIKLDDTLDQYFESPFYQKVTIKQLMTHTGGFIPEIRLNENITNPSDALAFILNQKPNYKIGSQFKYSCMGYIVLGKLLEQVGGNSLDYLCKQKVFNPLKMNNITYRPNLSNLFASTETDLKTNIILNGIVHDENAQFLNGISGNAGLFSPIEDLIKFTMMLLNQGKGFLLPDTFYKSTHNNIENSTQFRGLGFNLVNNNTSFFGTKVSDEAFGHTGFTGTSLVIDPFKKRGVILLTNRVHPTRQNKLLIEKRGEFHDLVFS